VLWILVGAGVVLAVVIVIGILGRPDDQSF
jgi:hypothetical protein